MKPLLFSALAIACGIAIACSSPEEQPQADEAQQHAEQEIKRSQPVDLSQFEDVDLGVDEAPPPNSLEAMIQNMTPQEVAERREKELANPAEYIATSVKLHRHGGSMRNRMRFLLQNRAYFTKYNNLKIQVDYVTRDNKLLEQGVYEYKRIMKPQEIIEFYEFQGEESPADWHHNKDGLRTRVLSVSVVEAPES